MENMRKIEHNKINTETTNNGLNKEERTTRQYTRTARILHPYNINSYILKKYVPHASIQEQRVYCTHTISTVTYSH